VLRAAWLLLLLPQCMMHSGRHASDNSKPKFDGGKSRRPLLLVLLLLQVLSVL
jgi:hypothetical protein